MLFKGELEITDLVSLSKKFAVARYNNQNLNFTIYITNLINLVELSSKKNVNFKKNVLERIIKILKNYSNFEDFTLFLYFFLTNDTVQIFNHKLTLLYKGELDDENKICETVINKLISLKNNFPVKENLLIHFFEKTFVFILTKNITKKYKTICISENGINVKEKNPFNKEVDYFIILNKVKPFFFKTNYKKRNEKPIGFSMFNYKNITTIQRFINAFNQGYTEEVEDDILRIKVTDNFLRNKGYSFLPEVFKKLLNKNFKKIFFNDETIVLIEKILLFSYDMSYKYKTMFFDKNFHRRNIYNYAKKRMIFYDEKKEFYFIYSYKIPL